MKYSKDQIVYIQGVFKGRVEKDEGGSIEVEPLEGSPKKGKTWHYARDLIKPDKSFKPKSIWLDQLDADFIRPDIKMKITSGDLLQLK